MTIIDVGDVRYLVRRELGADQAHALSIRDVVGGILIRNAKTNRFMICTKIEEAETDRENFKTHTPSTHP